MEGWGGGFADPILDGNGSLIVPSEQSPNYVAGLSGWSINQDGSAEFNDLTVRGTFFGTEYIINSAGIFLYSGTPAHGNMVGNWSVGGGVDAFGNNYQGGFNLVNAGGFLNMSQNNANPVIEFSTGNTSISGLNSNINADLTGFGTSQYDILSISSSRDGNNQDNVRIDLNSSNDVQSVFSAIKLIYAQPSIIGGETAYLEVNYQGTQIFAGSITAVDPTTGLAYTNAAMPETWHTMVLQNTSVFGANGAGFVAPRYRLEPQGGSTVVRLGGVLKLITANGGNETFWNAPSGYQAANGQHFAVAVKPTAGGATTNYVNVTTGAPFQVELINVGSVGDLIFLDGITYVVN